MAFTTIGTAQIEYRRIDAGDPDAQTIVMLHEGLGSVSMWKEFPEQLAGSTRCHVVVYSRQGYGGSSALHGPRRPRYMHDEALIVLPRFLDALDIHRPLLFGHSDGGSIALIHAGGSGREVAGIIAVAPHVFVEEVSVENISAAKTAYQNTNLRERLGRYHADVDGAFWGWNDIWLHPQFRSWNIEEYLPRIDCRILAIQGEQDEYGSMQQIERIGRRAPHVELLRLSPCGHSPHRDQPRAVLDAVSAWMGRG